MPRFEFACRVCGTSFDVVRQSADTTPSATCPIDGSDAALQAIFGDSLRLRPPQRDASARGQSRVRPDASSVVEHTH